MRWRKAKQEEKDVRKKWRVSFVYASYLTFLQKLISTLLYLPLYPQLHKERKNEVHGSKLLPKIAQLLSDEVKTKSTLYQLSPLSVLHTNSSRSKSMSLSCDQTLQSSTWTERATQLHQTRLLITMTLFLGLCYLHLCFSCCSRIKTRSWWVAKDVILWQLRKHSGTRCPLSLKPDLHPSIMMMSGGTENSLISQLPIIDSPNKYLLSVYYVLGTGPHPGDMRGIRQFMEDKKMNMFYKRMKIISNVTHIIMRVLWQKGTRRLKRLAYYFRQTSSEEVTFQPETLRMEEPSV